MISKVGHVKTGQATTALPTLTTAEKAGIGAAIGLGGFFAILRQAAAWNERKNADRYRELVAMEMARQDEAAARESELARLRDRTGTHTRMHMLRRGVYGGDVSTTESAAPYIMEAARREAMSNMYRGGY